MRIIGGEFRGTRLLPFRGRGTRPLLDATREALFNILGDRVYGVRVLDLFSGTGSFGLEALSRGASHCTFVEGGRAAVSVLRSNVEKLRVEDRCRIVAGDVFRVLARLPEGDPEAPALVFLDPPYKLLQDGSGARRFWEALGAAGGRLAPEATVVVHVEDSALGEGPGSEFRVEDERRYGRSVLYFLTPLAAESGPPGS